MTGTSWIEVDLGRLEQNVRAIRALLTRTAETPGVIRRRTGPALIAAATKADAYGIGAGPVMRRLANCVDFLAIYSPEQALEAAAYAPNTPIIMLMPVASIPLFELIPLARENRLHLSVHDRSDIPVLVRFARDAGIKLPVHLYVDSGMSRAGLDAARFPSILDEIFAATDLTVGGVYTHLATAEADGGFMQEQIDRFDRTVAPCLDRLPRDATIHVANSSGTLRDPAAHRDMVRVGLILWGFGAESLADAKPLIRPGEIKPVLRWRSSVAHVREYAEGAVVGYGSTARLTRRSRLALVPVGYGDGYPLLLSNRGHVTFPGRASAAGARVIGRVNMDQIVVDVTDHPAIGAGSLVELYSADFDSPSSLPTLATQAESHCYELLCRLSPRIERRYVTFGD